MYVKLSVVILSMTNSLELYQMTIDCIESLLSSEEDVSKEIILIESNKNYYRERFKYPEFVKVIIPDENFNFHKFLNIGIKASTGEFVALCNNDLIFYKNWFNEMLRTSQSNSKILSFSPGNQVKSDENKDGYEIGYKVRNHIMGWCIVVKSEIFIKIGFLDETFSFNYADNDYAMTLKRNNIKHALVYNSKVIHLDKEIRPDKSNTSLAYSNMAQNALVDLKIGRIPDYIFTERFEYLLMDNKALVDNINFHKKWGTPNEYYRLNKIADGLIKYNLGFFNYIVFRSRIIKFLLNLKK